MGMRDDLYSLSGSIELDEAFFTSENSDVAKKNEKLKAGSGSQRKSKVLVMIESASIDNGEKKKGKVTIQRIYHHTILTLQSLLSSYVKILQVAYIQKLFKN